MTKTCRPASTLVDLDSPPSMLVPLVEAALDAPADLTILKAPRDAARGDFPLEAMTAFTTLIGRLANHALDMRCITLACVPGQIDGFNLEVALRCDVLAVAPETMFRISRQSRHYPGIRQAFAERLGEQACERLIGQSKALDGHILLECGLALHAAPDGTFGPVIEAVGRKLSTMVPLFAASRLTFPVERRRIFETDCGRIRPF